MVNWLRHNQAALTDSEACTQKPKGGRPTLFICLYLSHSGAASSAYKGFLVLLLPAALAFKCYRDMGAWTALPNVQYNVAFRERHTRM